MVFLGLGLSGKRRNSVAMTASDRRGIPAQVGRIAPPTVSRMNSFAVCKIGGRAELIRQQVAKYTKRARRHVELGRLLIERHKEMVERHRVEGRDTTAAENLLVALERTQQVFERDLARLDLMKR
jgi:hypothetical protein